SIKIRKVRNLPPPWNSISTRSRPCEAATRSAVARIVSSLSDIAFFQAVFKANKKWVLTHSSLPSICRCAHGGFEQRNKSVNPDDTSSGGRFQYWEFLIAHI